MKISKIKVGCTKAMCLFVINSKLKTQFDASILAIKKIKSHDQNGLLLIKHEGKLTVCDESESHVDNDITIKHLGNGEWREATPEEIKELLIK